MSEREFVDRAFYWVRPKYEDGTEWGWTVAEWGECEGYRDAAGTFSVLRWLNHFRPQDLAEIGPMIGKEPSKLEWPRLPEKYEERPCPTCGEVRFCYGPEDRPCVLAVCENALTPRDNPPKPSP